MHSKYVICWILQSRTQSQGKDNGCCDWWLRTSLIKLDTGSQLADDLRGLDRCYGSIRMTVFKDAAPNVQLVLG